MNNAQKLDSVDLNILAELQKNGRIKNISQVEV